MQLPKYLLLITIVYSFKGVVALSYLLFFKKNITKIVMIQCEIMMNINHINTL
jgi:hypothetical protein